MWHVDELRRFGQGRGGGAFLRASSDVDSRVGSVGVFCAEVGGMLYVAGGGWLRLRVRDGTEGEGREGEGKET